MWEGELSSSALSTATALFALDLQDSPIDAAPADAALRRGAAEWLVRHQNPDGGWGDTVRSRSNLSTTVLCWSALTARESTPRPAMAAAERWLIRAAGSLDPDTLSAAVAERYGKDRTFSVPILTMAALAGRLGKGAWHLIPQLPFELAACPHGWFRRLSLPVVSYALPALIAMGLVRHRLGPPGNLLAETARHRVRGRVLRVLERIMPESGGFLEATPLTSFVVMSLTAAGESEHAVVRRGLDFLRRSARPDGSWPIDTNLSTWVTTLSVNALSVGAAGGRPGHQALPMLSGPERRRVADWLLGQQYRKLHPYTHAAPGGWAWTDLSGGVPDADDTAGALIALQHLGQPPGPEVAAGIRWLLDLQNRDGGIPTFCRGWTNLPFDRSGADLTAHALLAWSAWRGTLPPRLEQRAARGTARALEYLGRTQGRDGRWVPLWFGCETAPGEESPTYGTARVLPALAADGSPAAREMLLRGAEWLLAAQHPQGGWGGDRGSPPTIEETSLAVTALARAAGAAGNGGPGPDLRRAALDGAAWICRATEEGRTFEPAPIGFYFARLWYFERLYPLIFAAAALADAAHLADSRE